MFYVWAVVFDVSVCATCSNRKQFGSRRVAVHSLRDCSSLQLQPEGKHRRRLDTLLGAHTGWSVLPLPRGASSWERTDRPQARQRGAAGTGLVQNADVLGRMKLFYLLFCFNFFEGSHSIGTHELPTRMRRGKWERGCQERWILRGGSTLWALVALMSWPRRQSFCFV